MGTSNCQKKWKCQNSPMFGAFSQFGGVHFWDPLVTLLILLGGGTFWIFAIGGGSYSGWGSLIFGGILSNSKNVIFLFLFPLWSGRCYRFWYVSLSCQMFELPVQFHLDTNDKNGGKWCQKIHFLSSAQVLNSLGLPACQKIASLSFFSSTCNSGLDIMCTKARMPWGCQIDAHRFQLKKVGNCPKGIFSYHKESQKITKQRPLRRVPSLSLKCYNFLCFLCVSFVILFSWSPRLVKAHPEKK